MELNRPRKNLLFKLRPVLRWLLKLRGSSRAIAGGLGLGMFLAFTPTIGLQVVGALFLATCLNLNRAAAVVPVWITNPLTAAPIYTFNYWVGRHLWGGPPVGQVSKQLIDITRKLAKLDFFEVGVQFSTFMRLGQEVIIPLVLGSLIVGTVMGVLTYWGSYRFIAMLQARKMRRQKKMLDKGAARKN